MSRVMLVALAGFALAVVPARAVQQQAVRLTISVALTDASGAGTAVPSHPLLVSDYPPSRAPQRVVTGADGTASLNLRPGRYIVESGERVAFQNQAYRWIEIVDVAGDADVSLALTETNARTEPLTDDVSATPIVSVSEDETDADPLDVSPTGLRRRWRSSVVGIWTPTTHASGFVIDTRGLIATTRRAIGTATEVQVQITSSLKVAGRVIPSEADGDVALVRVHPDAVEFVTPLAPDCSAPVMPLRDDDEVYTIGAPLRGLPNLVFGTARRVNSRLVVADFNLRRLSPGGPVLAEDGRLVGVASTRDESVEFVFDGDAPIVSTDDACAALQATDALREPAPSGDRLPVDPDTLPTTEALESALEARGEDIEPYLLESEGFDITLLTPPLVYAGLRKADPPTLGLANWTDYAWDAPAVLLARVTPKLAEGFFSRLVRGAALTQGQIVSANLNFKSALHRMRAFCGEREVTPLHPFMIETPYGETITAGEGRQGVQQRVERVLREGLYAFAADALTPDCGTVRLELFSEDAPDRAEHVTIGPEVVERIHRDLAPFAGGPSW